MSKFWKTKAFRELEKVWEERLKEAGFKDSEKINRSHRRLKQNASNCYRQAPEVLREAKLRYYELLGLNFYNETFENPVHKTVISMRKDGFKLKEISFYLKSNGKPNHRETIRKILRFYEAKWQMKRK